MAMQMLIAGGMRPGQASKPPYEGDPTAIPGRDFTGTCIKILDDYVTAAAVAGPTRAWRFIWLDRDPIEQGRSYIKFLDWMGPVTGIYGGTFTAEQVARTYERDRPARITQLRQAGQLLVLDFAAVLRRPRKAASLIRREIFPGLNVDQAAAQVHQRDPACRPDMAVELSFANWPGRPPASTPPARSRT
jgi:hypothetical protein